MASCLPTKQALIRLAHLTSREPSDPQVVELFDQLVLRGHLQPFVPGWWELIRWDEAERGVASSGWAGDPAQSLIPEKSIGSTGFEPAT